MPLHAEIDRQRLIDQVAAEGAGAGLDPVFIHEFYKNVPPDDLLRRSPEDLISAVSAFWHFLEERRPGRPKLVVLAAQDSTQSGSGGRTAIQIANDNMPFLVASVTAALNRLDLAVHLVVHPVLTLARDAEGRLLGLGADRPDAFRESLILIELAGPVDAERRAAIIPELTKVLADVRAAVIDWGAMKRDIDHIIAGLGQAPVPIGEASEAAEFLSWLADNNFTFLGYREYEFAGQALKVVPGAGRGLLRDDEFLVFDGLRNLSAVSADVAAFLRSPQLIMISKSNRRSTVHRAAHLDTIGVKSFDADGHVIGQKLIVGLFTSAAYNQPPHSIPLLRRKVQRCLELSRFEPSGHDGKALQHILDTYPRDELYQIDEAELCQTALGIVNLQDRQRIALFARKDPFEGFISALVYVPRERYSAEFRGRMAAVLARAYAGSVAAQSTHLDDSALARIHVIVKTTPGKVPEIATATVEAELVEAGRVWADRLGEALIAAKGEEAGTELLRRFADALPNLYAERFSAATAVADIDRILHVEAGMPIALTFAANGAEGEFRLRTFQQNAPIALSDVLPVLENLGLKAINELPFEVRPRGAAPIWIQEFELEKRSRAAIDLARVIPLFEAAFPAIWSGTIENDGFNRLILAAGLSAREITVLRLYCKLLRQAGSTFSQAYMEDTVSAYPAIARLLIQLFEAQFDPARPSAARPAEIEHLEHEIAAALDAVANLDEDRILRSFLTLVTKSLRTNFYQRQTDGAPKPYLSVKLASQEIELLPLPRPLVEIFVYSPRIEGCHLRGGRVARGGIRWSDRKEDFRTEILGLMKAQMVKNSVIVPVGSKGGFVVKRPPAGDREALMAEVVACYKTLMFGLLDLTDTIDGDQIVPPPDVVRRDGDDPYLVVAADKGTATFSDIANGVAFDYGFWLGDAFASGGSVGYDHKAMGITARGAWEAVKRHFRELGADIQSTDFTCIGVGDMAGDVFGNGMLLSRHTRMIAAFNHQHIFLDPDPDAAASWAERKRLFDLPRSSWADYDPKLISSGGGVFERRAKSLALSPEIKARFGIAQDQLSPPELIRALLRYPVDLLWFGGIGTFVKSSAETQAEAGDRANDALRVNATELKAKVVGEGANLAMTQRGRIEYALKGGRLNTDAIDNSAGVDTSDHEVNIKIGLSALIAASKVASEGRASFLAAMTDEVGELVLADNYLQTAALSIAEAEGVAALDQHARLMRSLERAGKLDRALEFLPDDESLAQRAALKRGLTRPELAVLLAYAKNALYAELLGTDLPDAPELEAELLEYFPHAMRRLAPEVLKTHRLRREIVATHIANAVINRMGPSFVVELQGKTGRSAADIARAFRIMQCIFELPALWQAIEAQDNRISARAQIRLHLSIKSVAERATRWLLQSGLELAIEPMIRRFAPGIRQLAGKLPVLLPPGERHGFEARKSAFLDEGVPEDLALRAVALANLAAGLDIVRIDEAAGVDILEMGRLYYDAGERFGLDSLRDIARGLPAISSWQQLALGALIDDFYGLQREAVQRVLAEGNGSANGKLDSWVGDRPEAVARVAEIVAEIARATPPDIAMLTVASRQLRAMTGG
jgi:glutamate dehydrogenase